MKTWPIISSAPDTPDAPEIIANLWGGEVEISAVAVAPEVPASSQASMGSGTDGGGAAKLDTPDAQGGKMAPGPRGEAISGKDGKAPLPKFSLSAYNGGPMRLAGWKFPVVLDAAGAVGAAARGRAVQGASVVPDGARAGGAARGGQSLDRRRRVDAPESVDSPRARGPDRGRVVLGRSHLV